METQGVVVIHINKKDEFSSTVYSNATSRMRRKFKPEFNGTKTFHPFQPRHLAFTSQGKSFDGEAEQGEHLNGTCIDDLRDLDKRLDKEDIEEWVKLLRGSTSGTKGANGRMKRKFEQLQWRRRHSRRPSL
ncbi:hypothetical protein QJS10_CPB15g00555 [Acorus calamus]|uniref:Uncharacterized protein n=1 Tax=Acorus calamus TaxID=4465 RepID=A0AAV9D4K0_ACOCL|nr:hypothetical protein QJS10_CPB15g00555 [Acorus calamus]